MPASKTEGLTDSEIDQRQQAAKSHGAYAFERRGEIALNQTGRSRLQELKDQVQDRQGVLALMQERAANSVMMVELITSYIAKEHKSGKPLSHIKPLGSLPAFMNTAQRALKDLLSVMPDDKQVLDIGESITKAMEENEQNS